MPVDIQLREPHQVHLSIGIETHRTELEIHMPRRAKVNVHTRDGSVRVSGRFDVIELHTSDGRVEVEAPPGSQLREAWNISIPMAARCSDSPDLKADIALHTSDGSITTNIPIAVEGSFGRHDIHGKMNGGGNLLTVHTSDGSVTLDKF
jgi:hypothetical protein